jgi:hypothetical protein
MKKIDLDLNFDSIRKRIELDKSSFKPSDWSEFIGVSSNIISNIHGKTKQNPSLEYIIAVSKATKKSIEYYLWGNSRNLNDDLKPHTSILLETAKRILTSDNKQASTALEHSIMCFNEILDNDLRFKILEEQIFELRGNEKFNKKGRAI